MLDLVDLVEDQPKLDLDVFTLGHFRHHLIARISAVEQKLRGVRVTIPRGFLLPTELRVWVAWPPTDPAAAVHDPLPLRVRREPPEGPHGR